MARRDERMKMNKKRRNAAIMGAILETVGMQKLAERFVKLANNSGSTELMDVKESGFKVRTKDETTITIYGDPKSYAQIQKYLEEQGFEEIGGEFTYIPNDIKDVDLEMAEDIFEVDRDGRIVYIEYDG